MKINMTEEIYCAPGGTGNNSLVEYPHCVWGKILEAASIPKEARDRSETGEYMGYNYISCVLNIKDEDIINIFSINDGIRQFSEDGPNHYKALKLAIQMLQEKGHEVILPQVEFKDKAALVCQS